MKDKKSWIEILKEKLEESEKELKELEKESEKKEDTQTENARNLNGDNTK